MREWLEYAGFQCVRLMVLALPLKSAQRLGAALGAAAYRLVGSRRAIALDNLRHAFPEKSEAERVAIAKGAFRNYGMALIELLWFPNFTDASLRALLHPVGIERIGRKLGEGKGLIVLSGHYGNWELIAFGMSHLSGHPFSIIVQTQSNSRIDAVINRHRSAFGNICIPMGVSVREMLKTLHSGGVVAIAPDQSGPIEGVFVNFFGRSVASHQGPAAFALRTGAPMLMGFMIRQSDMTYEVRVEEVPSDDLTGYTPENVVELTQRHTAILEEFIRRHPDHWQWMHRRWKHTWESVQLELERRKPAAPGEAA